MHRVKCLYCKEVFDCDKIPFEKPNSTRYAHKTCADKVRAEKTELEKDRENLLNYLKSLFGENFITPRVLKQIKEFIEEYHYTYSGIHKALTYFYEIKGNSTSKANGGIGIVPHVYEHAFRYYYSLWEAKQRNQDKEIEDFVPKTKEIIIPIPQPKIRKRILFSFLDEEEH